MTIVKDSFKDGPQDNEYAIAVTKWLRGDLEKATCDVCGELVLDKKPFLWWSAYRHIILCCNCAEHTINGLNRDLVEWQGDKSAKLQSGDKYGPVFLNKEIKRLQRIVISYSQKIVELQDILARRD